MSGLFFTHFLVSSLISSALILVIMAVKKIFQKHIGTKWQYYIWFLMLIMLIIPFMPSRFFNFGSLFNWVLNYLSSKNTILANTNTLNNGIAHQFYNENWLQDFTMSVDRGVPTYINIIIMGVWFVGGIIYTTVTLLCNRDINVIKRSVELVRNKEIERIFLQCKLDLRIKSKLIIGESALIKTPMAFGLIKTYIVLPTGIMRQLSVDEIKHIILHELNHYKNKDIFINYAMCFFQIIYWFNPLVYLAFRQMRTDREIACDASVLGMLGEKSYIEYGRTIISFAEKLHQPSRLTMVTEMGGSKEQIKKRIEKIAVFKEETKRTKIKSMGIFILIGLLIFSQAPAISAMAFEDNKYVFQSESVFYEDLSSYFDGFEGSFVLYDMQSNQYNIYNKDRSVTRISPDSTYKIYSALIALESGVIDNDLSTQNWNGTNYPFDTWNHNQDLTSAMKSSVNWYFQNLDKSVGQKQLQTYFKAIQYGNYDLSGGLSNFWMESSLRISPVEQVKLLKDFYLNNTVFKPENIEVVKNVIKLSEKDGVTLSGKTGSGTVNGKGVNGWFIGYVERDGHTYIFATNIQDKDSASGSVAAKITLSILNDKGIY